MCLTRHCICRRPRRPPARHRRSVPQHRQRLNRPLSQSRPQHPQSPVPQLLPVPIRGKYRYHRPPRHRHPKKSLLLRRRCWTLPHPNWRWSWTCPRRAVQRPSLRPQMGPSCRPALMALMAVPVWNSTGPKLCRLCLPPPRCCHLSLRHHPTRRPLRRSHQPRFQSLAFPPTLIGLNLR